MSKPELCATRTAPRANSRNAGSTDSMRGASHTMAVVMPVSATICGGMDRPGSTRVASSPSTDPAADLDGADLGDLVVVAPARCRLAGPSAGGLQVDHDERRVAQRYLVHVERQLPGVGEARSGGQERSDPGCMRRHVVTVGRSTDIRCDLSERVVSVRSNEQNPNERSAAMVQRETPGQDAGRHRGRYRVRRHRLRRLRGPWTRLQGLRGECPARGARDSAGRRTSRARRAGRRRVGTAPAASANSSRASIGSRLTTRATGYSEIYSGAPVKFASSNGQPRCRFVTCLRPKSSSTRLATAVVRTQNLEA